MLSGPAGGITDGGIWRRQAARAWCPAAETRVTLEWAIPKTPTVRQARGNA